MYKEILCTILMSGYLSCIFTGIKATRLATEVGLPRPIKYFDALREGFLYSIGFKIDVKNETEIAYMSPWLSTAGAFLFFITHLGWFINQEYQTQGHLVGFLIAHYVAIAGTNYYHMISAQNWKKKLNEKSD